MVHSARRSVLLLRCLMVTIVMAIAAVLECLVFFACGGLESAPWLVLIAGAAASFAVTANLAKVENDAEDNWEVGAHALGLFLVYYVPLAFIGDIWPHKDWVAFIALTWCVPVWLYFGRPGWHFWPMSFMMGVIVSAFPGALLRWGLTAAAHPKKDDWFWKLLEKVLNPSDLETGYMVVGIFGSAIAVAALIIFMVKGVEYASEVGFMCMNCKMPGAVRFIARGDKLKFIVINRDGVYRDARRRMPNPAWLETGDFVHIREWKEHHGITDAVCEAVPFLLLMPGIYLIPLLAKQRKLKHPFVGAPHADADHGEEEHEEHGHDEDPDPVSCTALWVADVDIKKEIETGMTGSEITITLGTELRVSSPSAMYGAHHPEHNVDTAWDALSAEIGRQQGPYLVGYQGSLATLYNARRGFAATALSVQVDDVPGSPHLDHAYDHFVHTLAEVGLIPMEAGHILIHSTDESNTVAELRAMMMRVQAERRVAPIRAETVGAIQMGQFERLITILSDARLGLTAPQRAEALNRALTFLGDHNAAGWAQLMTQFGVATQAARSAAPPASGGNAGGGGGGGRTP